VGKEKVQVEANSLVESPKEIVHCLYNNSDKVARILVVKAPKPTTQAKLL
jgi:mannose-6-phosphate isomerase-like protein (cupin superfamily)